MQGKKTVNLFELLRSRTPPAGHSPEAPPREEPDPTPKSPKEHPNLLHINLKENPPHEEVATALPDWIIKNFNVIPHHYREGGVLVVVTLNPYDLLAEQEVRRHVGKVVFATADPEDFHYYRERILNTLARQQHALKEIAAELQQSGPAEPGTETRGAVPDFVNGLIREAILKGASDIHIEPTPSGGRIRFRIDGELQDHSTIQSPLVRAVISRLKVTAGLDPGESHLPQDGRITFSFNERRYRLRLSTIPVPYGESCVVRILPDSSNIPTLEDLGFLEDTLLLYRGVLKKPYGVILITGPTGSGKTTTLFASLQERYDPTLKLITVEDPIEYELPGAVQVQVNHEVGRTFARVLRSMLRHDPNIIVVGEIRDAETAKIAMEAGLTGHLVIATLHANTATYAPIRLMEMGVPPYLLSNLLAVLAQRLVRRNCTACAKPYTPSIPKEVQAFIPHQPNFLRGVGCPQCGGTGYKGRVAIHELLVFDDELHQALAKYRSAAMLETLAVKKGMRKLIHDGLIKAAQGITTVEEVLAKARV